MKKIISILGIFIFGIFIAVVLAFSIRGYTGSPSIQELNTLAWRDNGPLELSPERGRFALTYSIVENKSLIFSLPVARFIVPDLAVRSDGKYVSLFAPGISFLIVPGYYIGKFFGSTQLGAYAVISFLALINALLIYAILRALKVNKISGIIASMMFLFGSPAFAYAVNIYQHHATVFCLLMSIFILVRFKNLYVISLVWFFYALSFTIDYPNVYLLAPVALTALGRILQLSYKDKILSINVKFLGIFTFLGVLLPASFLIWYNTNAYSNPLQLAGTLKSVKALDAKGLPTDPTQTKDTNPIVVSSDPNAKETVKKKSATNFFKSRNILRGYIVHFLGLDRGMIVFAPILLLGFVGMATSYKKGHPLYATMCGSVFITILLYSMWGDPWGGWAFGSRYLIPAYAVLAIFLGIFLSEFKKYILVILLVLLVGSYSIAINTLGAITSSRNPPKVEVLELEKLSNQRQRYSIDRNFEYLNSNNSKSAFWQEIGHKYMDARTYYHVLAGSIILLFLVVCIAEYEKKKIRFKK